MISFGELSTKNVEQLRKLNLAVFPVRYNEKFYTDLASNPVQLYTHLGFFSDVLVGAICSRVEQQDDGKFKVYIMTIGVLAPYRRLGIGAQFAQPTALALRSCASHCSRLALACPLVACPPTPPSIHRLVIDASAGKRLLQQTLEACSKQSDCEEVYLHVQVGNDEAVSFYKGFDFEVGEIIKDYYTRLDPNDAHIISKKPPFVKPEAQ